MANSNSNNFMEWSSQEWSWEFVQDGSILFIAVHVAHSTPFSSRPRPESPPNLSNIYIADNTQAEMDEIDEIIERMSRLKI